MALLHQLRLEAPVAGVTATPAERVVLVIAQVLVEFLVVSCFETCTVNAFNRPSGPHGTIPASRAWHTICAITSRWALSGLAGSSGESAGTTATNLADSTANELLLVVISVVMTPPALPGDEAAYTVNRILPNGKKPRSILDVGSGGEGVGVSVEFLGVWTESLRECGRVVDEAYLSLARVQVEGAPDLGPSTVAARAVLDAVESGVCASAEAVRTVSMSMMAAADSFEELEEQIRAGMISEQAVFDA